VPDRRTKSIRRVHDALLQRHFVREHTRSGLHYRGVLDETGLKVPVVVSVNDLDFVTPPVIRLVDPGAGSAFRCCALSLAARRTVWAPAWSRAITLMVCALTDRQKTVANIPTPISSFVMAS
jgi:hypothetical protein